MSSSSIWRAVAAFGYGEHTNGYLGLDDARLVRGSFTNLVVTHGGYFNQYGYDFTAEQVPGTNGFGAFLQVNYARTTTTFHVRGYKEEGTTTTPFDRAVMNELDRFNLVDDVIDRVSRIQNRAGHVKQWLHNKLIEHKHYIAEHGEDMPEVREWRWPYEGSSS